MSPITHGLVGWTICCTAPLTKRERALIVLAAIFPDVDAAGVVIDFITLYAMGDATNYFETYHHVIGHNIGIGLLLTLFAYTVAREKKLLTALLALAAFHLHLLGDILGARGPFGNQWPVPYLLPFSSSLQLIWSGQWELNAWQNFVTTITLLFFMFYMAWRQALSPLEFFSDKINHGFVDALRKRFGMPKNQITVQ